jgi:hypothetical protein
MSSAKANTNLVKTYNIYLKNDKWNNVDQELKIIDKEAFDQVMKFLESYFLSTNLKQFWENCDSLLNSKDSIETKIGINRAIPGGRYGCA